MPALASTALPDSTPRRAHTVAMGALFFSNLGALGVYGPFLALWLADRGMSPSKIAFVLASFPIARLVFAPGWSMLADHLRSSERVLRWVALGALASFALLALPFGWAVTIGGLLLFNVFRAPCDSLSDALGLTWASQSGGDYGRIRSWGTVGYAVAAFGTGYLIDRSGSTAMVPLALLLLGLTAASSFGMPKAPPPEPEPLLPALKGLAMRPRFALFLGTTVLHQMGLAAYDNLFPAHLTALSSSRWAGAAIVVGTIAEFALMTQTSRLIGRIGSARTLALSYGGSALRWAILASANQPWLLVSAQLLHGLSYGTFYVAAVTLVGEESPPEVRASAQGVFSAVFYGIAASLALGLAGLVQPHGGLPAVFAIGVVASVLGTVVALRIERPRIEVPAASGAPEAG